MGAKEAVIYGIVAVVITNIAFLAMGSVIFAHTKDAIELTDFSFDGFTQLTTDWTTTPYTNITVSNSTCEGGWSNVFNDFFPGTATGCYVTSCSGRHYI